MIMGAVAVLRGEIAKIQEKIDVIQSKCSHPAEAVEITNKCGGEFDNEYWRICVCHLCEKRWTEDQ